MCNWNARLILSEVDGSGPSLCCGQFFTLSHSRCVGHRRADGLGPPVILIAVVALHPVCEVAVPGLVAPFRHDVEPAVDGEEDLPAAAIGGIGMVDRTVVVLVEDADARELVNLGIGPFLEIVVNAPLA